MTISKDVKQAISKIIADEGKAAHNMALEIAARIVRQESERLSDCTPQFVADIIIERLAGLRK